MEEIIKLIETFNEDEIDLLCEKLKEYVIIPFYFRKEDLKNVLDDFHQDPSGVMDTPIYSVTLRYYKIREQNLTDGTLFFDDIYRHLIEYTKEVDVGDYWSYFIDTILFGLEDFDITNRDDKIDEILND